MEEHERKQSISRSSGRSTSATACKYCMNNDCGGDTSTRLPCIHKFHHTSTNNWLLCNQRPRCLWVCQLMELLEALFFKIVSVEGTASWGSFNFQGLCGWARVAKPRKLVDLKLLYPAIDETWQEERSSQQFQLPTIVKLAFSAVCNFPLSLSGSIAFTRIVLLPNMKRISIDELQASDEMPRNDNDVLMLRARFLDLGGGGGKKKKKKKKSNTEVLIGSCSEYEFSSLSVGVGKVHTQDGGVHEGNNGNDGATEQVHEVTNDGNPNETGLESIMKEAPSTYANKLSHTSLTKANIRKLDANVPNDADFDIWLPLASVHGEPPRCGTCLIFGHSVDDYPKSPKRRVNMMDKGNGGSSGVDDEGFVIVKKKKSCGNDGGTKNFKPISMKPKTQYRPKVNQSTKGGDSNSFEALNVDDSVTGEVESGNKASTSDGKCVLVNDDGNPLAKVGYSGDHDTDDEVEPLDNEMTSYLASKSSGLDMVLIACWNNEEKHTGMLNTTTTQMMMICMKVMKFLTIFNLYAIIWISRFEDERRNRLLDIASLVV
nr:zinc knuckle CX2CX4HX4C [Tanacetum cinerariifolium]